MGTSLRGNGRSMLYAAGVVMFLTVVHSCPVQAADSGWKTEAGVAAILDQREKDSGKTGSGDSVEKTEKESGEKETAAETASGQEDGEKLQKTGNGAEKGKGSKPGDIVMAHVHNVLNVREEPDESAGIEGYLYADCGGYVIERRDGWTKLESGELKGWAKDDYLLFGRDAEDAAYNAGRMVAKTTTGALRIRKAPSLDAGVYDMLEEGAEYEVVNEEQLAFSDNMELSDDWVAVDYEGKTGFVSAEFVKVEFLVDEGETRKNVEARAEEQEKKKAQQKKEQQQKEIERAQALAAPDLELLGALIQCEAGNEPYEGQVAVGAVVMNRVKSPAYPNTIRDVIFASGQFTPAGSGQLGRRISSGNVKASCMQAAQDAMAGVSPVGTATHFRRAGNREGLIIGHHVFW